MTTQLEARAFAIWRYAAPRDWDCSYEEIAEALGITRPQVKYAILVKGWQGRIDRNAFTSETSYLAKKANGKRFDENALDLCQIMGV